MDGSSEVLPSTSSIGYLDNFDNHKQYNFNSIDDSIIFFEKNPNLIHQDFLNNFHMHLPGYREKNMELLKYVANKKVSDFDNEYGENIINLKRFNQFKRKYNQNLFDFWEDVDNTIDNKLNLNRKLLSNSILNNRNSFLQIPIYLEMRKLGHTHYGLIN